QQFSLPGADPKCFRVWPWYVPEDRNAGVGPILLDQSRQKCEVIILHQDGRFAQPTYLVQHHFGELAIDRLILLPVTRSEYGTGMRDVAQRPHPFIGESIVISFLFPLREPHAA